MAEHCRKGNSMNSIRMLLIPLAIIACVSSASADTPEASPPTATPLGSPGLWLESDDYPATALRYAMTGMTSFRMTVDATGKPSRCDIVESSGFDVLDRATCSRLMANAKFSPPRDPAGKLAEGTYAGRVKWVMPAGAQSPVSENFASMLLSIDQAGKVMTCKVAVHIPAIAATREKPCEHEAEMMPLVMGIALRGNYQGASAEVEIRQADVFTPDLLARVLAPMPGYEQRALNVTVSQRIRTAGLANASIWNSVEAIKWRRTFAALSLTRNLIRHSPHSTKMAMRADGILSECC
ncbi:TonB family protein [Sphingobium subterraneum]|uniref:TonB family protein n=1 Tax=Sphingobium subterraneum TaxID=627688 RepID=A0A841J266_9SPHN|nr:TonB family protein [Sphingobium subterraneum]